MTVHEFTVRTADGGSKALREYAGQALLIVNVASKCGLTPQYAGLEELHQTSHPRGLRVLGFPCNQFGGQEPGSDAEIQEFCDVNYSVSFPVFAKIDVNGPNADPLYQYLRAQDPGDLGPDNPMYEHLKNAQPESLGTDEIKWNFTKFLVGKDGKVIRRYEPTVTPEQLREDVEAALTS
ncbi:glutathione peroxidase [Tamaricihabitans halophyticus]|uniref:Glutathione peroxidase n=1 Tax=Tamaricihabitans halophyticus TaxID=1262583 RepID=A0A4R2Q3S4_9PSEU|nr:glutathione peroxidase [Tamaricihabitans halophyticus]TCP43413.1 glutathione peroxidase [Tamaricihabitans halophyticus]